MPYRDIAPFYDGLSLSERLYARIRYATAPLERVAALVPPGVRRLVELGCSAGVFANVLKVRRPEIDVLGVDADEKKIATARRTVRDRAGLAFAVGDARSFLERDETQDAVVFVDMLYLLPPVTQDELVALAVDRLAADGCLIIKEMTDRPRWKRLWCEAQERLAVRVFGFTKGAGIYLRPGEEYRRVMAAAGLTVDSFDLGRGYPHPHFALRGRKIT